MTRIFAVAFVLFAGSLHAGPPVDWGYATSNPCGAGKIEKGWGTAFTSGNGTGQDMGERPFSLSGASVCAHAYAENIYSCPDFTITDSAVTKRVGFSRSSSCNQGFLHNCLVERYCAPDTAPEPTPPPVPCGDDEGTSYGGASPAQYETYCGSASCSASASNQACMNNCKSKMYMTINVGDPNVSGYSWYSTGEDCGPIAPISAEPTESTCVENFPENIDPANPAHAAAICSDTADAGDSINAPRQTHVGEDLQVPSIYDEMAGSATSRTAQGGEEFIGFANDPNGGDNLTSAWDLDYMGGRCAHYPVGQTGAGTVCGGNVNVVDTNGQSVPPIGTVTIYSAGNTQQTINYYQGLVHAHGAPTGPGTTSGGGIPGSGDGGTTGGSTGGATGGGDCVGSDCALGDSGISGGTSCTQAPVCEGDPIQCFQARKAWEQWCQVQPPSGSDMDAAIDDGLKVGGQSLADYLDGDGDTDVSELLSLPDPTACIVEDITVTFWIGPPVVIPLSDFCALFSAIGLFVLISATLKSIMIVVEGFK